VPENRSVNQLKLLDSYRLFSRVIITYLDTCEAFTYLENGDYDKNERKPIRVSSFYD